MQVNSTLCIANSVSYWPQDVSGVQRSSYHVDPEFQKSVATTRFLITRFVYNAMEVLGNTVLITQVLSECNTIEHVTTGHKLHRIGGKRSASILFITRDI